MTKQDPEFYRALRAKTPYCTEEEFKMLLSRVDDKSELCAALKIRADDCSPTEFRELLLRFGHDSQALETMQKAIDARGRIEDSGSYCESASSGWSTYFKKKNMLIDYRLGLGEFKDVFREATAVKEPVPAEAPTLQHIFDLLVAQGKRIEKLENARNQNPPHRGGGIVLVKKSKAI